MVHVQMYTAPNCHYCVRAKRLLAERGIAYEEVDVAHDPDLRAEVIRRSGGRRTVPQIFLDGQSIGGYQELAALDAAGGLARFRKADAG